MEHQFTFCPFARMVWTQMGLRLKLPITPSSSLENIMNTTVYGLNNGSSMQKVIKFGPQIDLMKHMETKE